MYSVRGQVHLKVWSAIAFSCVWARAVCLDTLLLFSISFDLTRSPWGRSLERIGLFHWFMYWGTLRERHANELAAAALPKSDGKTAKHVYKKKPNKIENRRKGWDLCTHIDTPKKTKRFKQRKISKIYIWCIYLWLIKRWEIRSILNFHFFLMERKEIAGSCVCCCGCKTTEMFIILHQWKRKRKC